MSLEFSLGFRRSGSGFRWLKGLLFSTTSRCGPELYKKPADLWKYM